MSLTSHCYIQQILMENTCWELLIETFSTLLRSHLGFPCPSGSPVLGGLVTCLAPQNCTANNKRCNVLSLWWLERWNS